ncbi:hypothetical protein E1H12_12285 [Geitlerinema sp. P-1104]|uniref:hypothetical protein n=1 Tax=Geitlerinema sp. P-1104 TaxID=2546230 RepID=UPI0014770412|nr:hypothetical protein [Geitlerinema sp. P-1104]NMG59270.1 hypothetical protein [Geitlerinema sp. P-1104]
MFLNHEIIELTSLLEKRNVSLYHACQLQDFISYLKIGGIPSRSYLESTGHEFTNFDTDSSDRKANVWDKIFFNLSDFGSTFANEKIAVPNPFGPILLKVKCTSIQESKDVAICLRSAGGRNFNRESESLDSLEEVNKLFLYSDNDPTRSHLVKYAQNLKEDFIDKKSISSPEISCTIMTGYIPLSEVISVQVEPYSIYNHQLLSKVKSITSDFPQLQTSIYSRPSLPSYAEELVKLLEREEITLQHIQNSNVSIELKTWADKLRKKELDYQFKRFAKYLRAGTILPFYSLT